jgi:hypothetical protein
MFIVIACPLPLVLCFWINGSNNGRKAVLWALAAAFVPCWLLLSPLAIMDFIYYLGLAVGIGESLNRGKNMFAIIAWATALASIVRLLSLMFIAWQYEQGIVAFWDSLFKQITDDYIIPGAADPQSLEYITVFISTIRILAPAIMVIASMFTAWLILLVINQAAKRTGRKFPYASLTSWQVPVNLAWVFIAMAALYLFSNEVMAGISANILLVISVLYMLQGLIVINCQIIYRCKALNIPDEWRIIGLLIISLLVLALVIIALLAGIVVMVGLFDTWFNLRKRNNMEKLSGG